MSNIYVIREREWGAFWCPIDGKWNWTDNVRAAKTFSSNEEAAAEFRRIGLDPVGYMVSIISVSLDCLGVPVAKDRTFMQNTLGYPGLTSEAATSMILSMGGKVVKWRYSDRTIYLPECTIEIEDDGTIRIKGMTEEEFGRLYCKIIGN
nr:MAG TPA: hypothetical protein [Caudoviricetes sp.]